MICFESRWDIAELLSYPSNIPFKVEAVEKTEPNGNCHGQPNETNQTSQQSISQQNLQNSSGKPWFQNEILCMM